MKRGKHIAHQFDLPLIEQRPRERVTLPPNRSMLRIVGSPTDINGAWKVKSAMHLPGGGIFLGLEPLVFQKARPAVAPYQQEELFV